MSTETTTAIPDDDGNDGKMLPLIETAIRRDATVMEIASVIAASRDFPDCRTTEKAAVRIMAGKEMNVGPIASVIGIRIQNGRVSMEAMLMAGVIKRSRDYNYSVEEHDIERCRLNFYEGGKLVGDSVFTMDDAKKASLAGKDTWKGYPRNMLFARALSNGARWYCAALFGGAIYTHEELGYQVDGEGNAIDTAATGNDLCTRDQRQEIARLVIAVGDSMPGYLANLGIRLLDELSQGEGAKEIKKLQKRLAKVQGTAATMLPATEATPTETTPATGAAATTITEATAEAFDESRKPSTPEQLDAIRGLMKFLIVGGTDEANQLRFDTLVKALAKRNCKRLAELNQLQAAALIEGIQAQIAQAKADNKSPPFETAPATGKAAN